MKTIKHPILQFHLVLILLFAINASSAKSQSVDILTDLSATEVVSGEQVILTVSTDGESDIFFFSAEIEFDPDQLEFTDAVAAGAMLPESLITFDPLSPGVYGVSVTRTDPLPEPTSGDLLQVTFTVKQFSDAGEGEISYSNINFADSQGDEIDFNDPPESEYSVEKTLTDLRLTTPQSIVITEGDSFEAAGEVFATGITVDDENTDTLQVWIGVNTIDEDLSNWSEDKWELMNYVDQTDNDYFTYSSDVAFQRTVGTYYIALRSEIVNSGNYSYGGVGGFWDPTENPLAMLEIQQQGDHQYVVAEWTFENEVYTPDQSIGPNQTAELELVGASMNGFTAGAANSNGWDDFAEGENYWQITINTEGLEELELSSDNSGGSSTGPRDFKVQYGTDGSSWNDLNGGDIEVGSDTLESIDQLPLPGILEDEPEVYIRWLQISDVRVDGNTEQEIGSGGTSRIDDILITGQAASPNRVDVWPGDTNNDDIVDENDLIPLGNYWLAAGPQAIYPTIEFEAREAEEWIPAISTHADANGDGRVDQNDLQPIGLHFEESVPSEEAAESQLPPISELTLEPLEAGETKDIYITTPEPIDLSGISLRIDILGLDDRKWSISQIDPLEWGNLWEQENRLLQFAKRKDGIYAAAIVHKGKVEPASSPNLVRLSIKAEQPWQTERAVRLLRGSVTANGETITLTDAELSSEMAVSIKPPVTEQPVRTELLPNYPNPFNPVTTIPFTISEPGAAQIEVFDAIGRKVAGVRYDIQPAGSYTYQFDASALSSGLYLYRLRVNGIVQTRKMLLLK